MDKIKLEVGLMGNNGDPRAGGWRNSPRLSVLRKKLEKSRVTNKYNQGKK